jgi:hypothetical protein
MHFRYEHDFDIDPQGYWDIFLSEEFTVELYKHLKMRDRQLLENKDDGTVLRRVQKLTPDSEMPAFIKALVSDVSYTEHDLYRKDRSEMEVVVEPAMLKNKFDLKGLYAVKPLGPGRCRRSFEGDVKVSIMLVGGQVEKFMCEQMKDSYETAARLVREWIAKRAATAPNA